MISYPVREVHRGLVTLGNSELRLLLWLVGNGFRSATGNGDASPPEIICDAADMEINVVHLAKLLRRLLVVALRLGIELNLVVAVLSLATISSNSGKDRVRTPLTRALL